MPARACRCQEITQVEYLRHARRLRARLEGRPLLLHQTLRKLGEDRDRLTAVAQLEPQEIFQNMVRAELEGNVLRFSRRTKLLARARTMGLEHFAACLII